MGILFGLCVMSGMTLESASLLPWENWDDPEDLNSVMAHLSLEESHIKRDLSMQGHRCFTLILAEMQPAHCIHPFCFLLYPIFMLHHFYFDHFSISSSVFINI